MATPEDSDRDTTPEDRPARDLSGQHYSAQDHDPTGVRALLAGLPDPGPMPDDLIQRIGARLEVERARQAEGASDPSVFAGSGTDVVDLSDERSRRRPTRTLALLGAAAVGLAVTTVTLTQFLGTGDSGDVGTAAQYPSGNVTSSDDAEAEMGSSLDEDPGGAGGSEPERAVGDAAGEEEGSAAEDLELLSSVEVTVLPELGPVRDSTYGEHILERRGEGVTPATGALTTFQAQTCWNSLPSVRWDEHYAAAATYLPPGSAPEQAVVVLLGVNATGDAHAWLMPQNCVDSTATEPIEPAGSPLQSP